MEQKLLQVPNGSNTRKKKSTFRYFSQKKNRPKPRVAHPPRSSAVFFSSSKSQRYNDQWNHSMTNCLLSLRSAPDRSKLPMVRFKPPPPKSSHINIIFLKKSPRSCNFDIEMKGHQEARMKKKLRKAALKKQLCMISSCASFKLNFSGAVTYLVDGFNPFEKY